jgi:lipoyl(octanoyl) transferase
MRKCELRDLGRLGYAQAFEVQRSFVEQRKRGEVPDQLLFVEHPHVITLGRNGHMENLLASEFALKSAGIEFFESDRGGDITYHGPGQVVGYPIFDLKEWKRDVGRFLRTMEEAVIGTLAELGLVGERVDKATGVWVGGAKICAMGVHLSRWVTSHGFALNLSTDLRFFQYIVPCGLAKPVTSIEALGIQASREAVQTSLAHRFAANFDLEMVAPRELSLSTERFL